MIDFEDIKAALGEWIEARQSLNALSPTFEQTKKGNEIVVTPEWTAAWDRLARAEAGLAAIASSTSGEASGT